MWKSQVYEESLWKLEHLHCPHALNNVNHWRQKSSVQSWDYENVQYLRCRLHGNKRFKWFYVSYFLKCLQTLTGSFIMNSYVKKFYRCIYTYIVIHIPFSKYDIYIYKYDVSVNLYHYQYTLKPILFLQVHIRKRNHINVIMLLTSTKGLVNING